MNRLRNFLYFVIIGWFLWIMEKLREGQKAKQEVLIDTYELKKKEIESGVKDEDIDKLVSDTNAKYKSSGGSGSNN